MAGTLWVGPSRELGPAGRSQRGRRDFHDTSRERVGPSHMAGSRWPANPAGLEAGVARSQGGFRAGSGRGVKLQLGGSSVGRRK